ncbi:LysR family transcriptional regulator [Martelella sp. HB161492]|uniref:LysR family transcriptional regulator n=1 Tax=Martelella sp. HB161492 TaxID=2720726 RepID=UPI0015904DB1|nr:LysR family transcriptional regulator [Martelella sp. HB161492]
MLHGRLLNYLDEVARTGSVRRTAERLNVSASAISRQIASLEEELDTQIFTRTKRRLTLTAAGEILIGHVRDTLKGMNRAEAMIEDLKGLRRGEVTIALMSGLAANLVPRAIGLFQRAMPGVRVSLKLMTTGDDIREAVTSGAADLGLGFDFPADIEIAVHEIAIGRLGVAVAPDHPLARSTSIRLSECVGYPMVVADPTTAIRPHIDQVFARANLQLHFAIEANSIEMMRHLAMSEGYVTFLTPFDIAFESRMGRLTYVPVREFQSDTQQLMLIGGRRNLSALASVFAEHMRGVMRAD